MVALVESWEKVASQLRSWTVLFADLLSKGTTHPETAKIMALMEYTAGLSARLRDQGSEPTPTLLTCHPLVPDSIGIKQKYPPGAQEAEQGVLDRLRRSQTGTGDQQLLSGDSNDSGHPGAATDAAIPPSSASHRHTKHTAVIYSQLEREATPWPDPALQEAPDFF